MSVTLMDFLIPKFMELGWSIADGVWRINKSLAFAFWQRKDESAMEDECCSHCHGEWELVLYFDEKAKLQDMMKIATNVWSVVAPPWMAADLGSMNIITSGYGGDRRAHYDWKKWVQDDHPAEAACYPNYSHWPVVFARVD